MIGVLIEASTDCLSCRQPVPLNALVPMIVCAKCGTAASIKPAEWQNILEEPLKDAPYLDELEGGNLTIMAGRTFRLRYGRQAPHFRDTKTAINVDEALGGSSVSNPETGTPWSVRELPGEYADALPGVTHLLCEQWSLLPSTEGATGNMKAARSSRPQPFTCPSCGGQLEVDGQTRAVVCQFCQTTSYLADQLWQRLHPVETVSRWYLWYDPMRRLFHWESDLYDAAVDDAGNLYVACELDAVGFCVASIGRDRKLRWIREDLDAYEGRAHLAFRAPRQILLYSDSRNSLMILSAADGTRVDKLGGVDGRQPSEGAFSLKQQGQLAVDLDGTLLAYRRAPEDTNRRYEIARYDDDGNTRPVWPEPAEPPRKPGFFSKLKRAFSSTPRPADFETIGDRWFGCTSWPVIPSVGLDGSYFFTNYNRVARYSRDGTQLYSIELPIAPREYRVCGDESGVAYLLARSPAEQWQLMTISADGHQVAVLVDNVRAGGHLCDEEVLVRQADGTMHALGYRGRFVTLSASGELLYASKNSLEEAKQAHEKHREDND